ncbi:hypothetical protein COU57_02255 [Candidatus Pacearchaeota archaeon CG10_big_fil_rev_8_21_14_0_10_32_14]|nr:MAG: hypothetical protein COU57_02255 [Candidatus Pacearchaeota archaeon CG10_big_fil_rev_8_21_14_0_10_32_14]
MAYIFPNEPMGYGRKTTSYVIGDEEKNEICNVTRNKTMSYDELVRIYKKHNRKVASVKIGNALSVCGEELELLCSKLFIELREGKFERLKYDITELKTTPHRTGNKS